MSKRMPLVFNDPRHWRARAVEAQAIAEQMLDVEGRARMLAIAEQYEMLAARAVERLKALAQGRRPIVSESTGRPRH